jgi:diacylglycerol kinase family enzyme
MTSTDPGVAEDQEPTAAQRRDDGIPAFVNPAAGNAADVDRALRKAGCFDVCDVAPDQVMQAVESAIERGATRVVVAGGDGTVSAAAAAVARTNVELAVIPAGTFNHFARDHGIPEDLDHACEVASTGHVIDADVAWVNGRLFLNTSSVGAYANFVRVREAREPRWGYWGSSLFAMARTLVRLRPFTAHFEAEGIERVYKTPLVFIGVGERELKLPTLGARTENGRHGLHVMIVRGRTRARLVALAFEAATRGTRALSRTPHFDSFVVERCVVEQRHSTVAVDGEVVTMESPLEYELGHGALRLVVPLPAPAP